MAIMPLAKNLSRLDPATVFSSSPLDPDSGRITTILHHEPKEISYVEKKEAQELLAGAGGREVAPFSAAGFAKMIERAGVAARFKFKAHPHMLRHACGYKLANDGHDTRSLQAYLGHRNIQHTVRYSELSPTRFKDFWR
jgi:site-specific recombinase XerD